MTLKSDPLTRISRERLAQLVSAASYGCVLVLVALSAYSLIHIEIGHGAELVAGVGVATWIAHLYAELLGRQVEHRHRLSGREITEDMVDGSPILVSTILPGLILLLGRLEVLSATVARNIAVVVALLQLLAIGALVSRLSPAPFRAKVIFASVTVLFGLATVAISIALGH